MNIPHSLTINRLFSSKRNNITAGIVKHVFPLFDEHRVTTHTCKPSAYLLFTTVGRIDSCCCRFPCICDFMR
ncbi:hypothetical protein Y032_0014g2211 [Ancylostoma ceylanicum]|uniref:Uncharacterized protein n=1 Tax=Ancylostoma ceylanicum TaxID=53326 RepID=A0A016VA65_9BILA|nr:hypothetical protein Y032_0014g2211 [Ancylostoma ceylanicum]